MHLVAVVAVVAVSGFFWLFAFSLIGGGVLQKRVRVSRALQVSQVLFLSTIRFTIQEKGRLLKGEFVILVGLAILALFLKTANGSNRLHFLIDVISLFGAVGDIALHLSFSSWTRQAILLLTLCPLLPFV